MSTTAMMNAVEVMPRIDVYESSESGMKTVGTSLDFDQIHVHGRRSTSLHERAPDLVCVSGVCRDESMQRVGRESDEGNTGSNLSVTPEVVGSVGHKPDGEQLEAEHGTDPRDGAGPERFLSNVGVRAQAWL
jgi:hypothetical protein